MMSLSEGDVVPEGKDIEDLLDRLRRGNDENDYGGLLRQRLGPPVSAKKGLPTLRKNVYRPVSPMLEPRFRMAGTWDNAGVGHTWLGPVEMEKSWSAARVRKQIAIRRDHWPNSVLRRYEDECVCLFGIEMEESEETYLAWRGTDVEPLVVLYSGHEEKEFENFKTFLLYLLGGDTQLG
jgi:hypothetical protein